MEIKVDDLSGSQVTALVMEHLLHMQSLSPPESTHALNLDGLKEPKCTFWSGWEQGELVGCGAMKELEPQHGELKSMRTASAHHRKGVAKRILTHIVNEAKQRGYTRVSLETGSMEAFEPARKLYESFGFRYCKPFANYTDDPLSSFMTLEL